MSENKEFNLSEKRKELLKHTIDALEEDAINIEDVFIQIEKQDKEFIKKLKGPIKSELIFINEHNPKNNNMRTVEMLLNQILKEIDKLAGDDLK